MRRWWRRWTLPLTSEAVELGGYRFRITWHRHRLTHRRGPIAGIEMWTPLPTNSADGTVYTYAVWKDPECPS